MKPNANVKPKVLIEIAQNVDLGLHGGEAAGIGIVAPTLWHV